MHVIFLPTCLHASVFEHGMMYILSITVWNVGASMELNKYAENITITVKSL